MVLPGVKDPVPVVVHNTLVWFEAVPLNKYSVVPQVTPLLPALQTGAFQIVRTMERTMFVQGALAVTFNVSVTLPVLISAWLGV